MDFIYVVVEEGPWYWIYKGDGIGTLFGVALAKCTTERSAKLICDALNTYKKGAA